MQIQPVELPLTVLGREVRTFAAPRPDGGTLAFSTFGADDGQVFLYSHGAGSSRLAAASGHAAAAAAGVRIIAIDRPGYGRSSPGSRPTLLSHAPDAAALLDHLGVDRCVVGGISDGGAVSMALAAALPDRVTHVVPINSPVSPLDPSFEAVAPEAQATIPLLTKGVAQQVFGAMQQDPIATMAAANVMAAADRALLDDPEQATFIAASIKEGLLQGLDAVLEEMAAMYDLPWGFDWGSPQAPVSLFVAEHDMSIGAARLLAARHPGVTLFEIAGAGHLGGHTDAVWRDVFRTAFG